MKGLGSCEGKMLVRSRLETVEEQTQAVSVPSLPRYEPRLRTSLPSSH